MPKCGICGAEVPEQPRVTEEGIEITVMDQIFIASRQL